MKRILLVLFIAVALVSCNKEELIIEDGQSEVVIKKSNAEIIGQMIEDGIEITYLTLATHGINVPQLKADPNAPDPEVTACSTWTGSMLNDDRILHSVFITQSGKIMYQQFDAGGTLLGSTEVYVSPTQLCRALGKEI